MPTWTVTLTVLINAKDVDRATTAVRTVELPFIPTKGFTICLASRNPDDACFTCDDVVYDLQTGTFRAVQFTDTDHFDQVLAVYTSTGFVDQSPRQA